MKKHLFFWTLTVTLMAAGMTASIVYHNKYGWLLVVAAAAVERIRRQQSRKYYNGSN